MQAMTLDALYKQLQEDAKARGSLHGQVWHEADIDGYHLYMADTSFGDGPLFRITGEAVHYGWQSPDSSNWYPLYVGQPDEPPAWAMQLAERADWSYRLQLLDPLR